jgi:hypothetical protein
LALVTQLLALQVLAEATSSALCAFDGRFSAKTDSNPTTSKVASAQSVRLIAPRRTSSRKAVPMHDRSTKSVADLYRSKIKPAFRNPRLDRRALCLFLTEARRVRGKCDHHRCRDVDVVRASPSSRLSDGWCRPMRALVALAAVSPSVKICQVQIFLEGKYLNNNMYFR